MSQAPVRCAIVDDEELARRLVASYCGRLPRLVVAWQSADPLEARRRLGEEPVDLLFLDIRMPHLTGLDLLASLRHPPVTVLTTAYGEYALAGYEHDAVDYLVKPFAFERFLRAVDKALAQISAPAAPPPAHRLVRADHRIYRLAYADIRYVRGMREYVAYHQTDGSRILALESLRQLADELPPNFLRVHRSYLVNLEWVTALEGNLLHLGPDRIPVGRSYRPVVRARFSPGGGPGGA